MQSTDTARAAISNPTVAEALGIDATMVSRMRSGKRIPSITTMAAVEKAYGWSMDKQVDAALSHQYHIKFEAMLIDKFGIDNPNKEGSTS